MNAIQFTLAIGLITAADTAKRGGLNRHEAQKVLREMAHDHELPVSNKSVRDAVGAVYRKEGGIK